MWQWRDDNARFVSPFRHKSSNICFFPQLLILRIHTWNFNFFYSHYWVPLWPRLLSRWYQKYETTSFETWKKNLAIEKKGECNDRIFYHFMLNPFQISSPSGAQLKPYFSPKIPCWLRSELPKKETYQRGVRNTRLEMEGKRMIGDIFPQFFLTQLAAYMRSRPPFISWQKFSTTFQRKITCICLYLLVPKLNVKRQRIMGELHSTKAEIQLKNEFKGFF